MFVRIVLLLIAAVFALAVAAHRSSGAGPEHRYLVKPGDSLWSITQKSLKVPVWLLQQYNPDLDFGNLRPGTQISLPKVEDVSSL